MASQCNILCAATGLPAGAGVQPGWTGAGCAECAARGQRDRPCDSHPASYRAAATERRLSKHGPACRSAQPASRSGCIVNAPQSRK